MSELLARWHAVWATPVAAGRPWLLARGLLAVLAVDAWTLMVVRAGRYGVGDFNVAHFGWMDALLPAPTAASQLVVLLLSGALAALGALGVLGRLGLGLLVALYSYAWMASQLDSYQHHYFLSWALFCVVFFPRDQLVAAARVQAWSTRLFAALCANLYAFTALSKTETQWLRGEVLQRIHDGSGAFEPLLAASSLFGLSEETAWLLAGISVVVVQIIICAAYLAAALTAESSRVGRALRWTGLVLAITFHGLAEHLGLRIGWFSIYMIFVAFTLLSPESWVRALTAWPARLGAWARRATTTVSPLVAWFAVLVALVGLAAVAYQLDLPGAAIGCGLAGSLAAVALATSALRGGPRAAARYAIAIVAVTSALHLTLDVTHTRYDYWRFVGGDALRRLDLPAAHDAYALTNTWAPDGETRWNKVLQVRSVKPGKDGGDPL